MSAALLPAIQMAMVNKYASCGMKFPVWQGGIRVSAVEYEHTETLIEVPYGQVALNIITRGPNQANVCEQQQEIWHHIQTLSLRISPGSELEPVFVDDDCLSSSRQLQGLDIKGELNAGLAFFASDHLRSQCPLPPAAYADVGERPDVRLLHRYCKGASCENAGTSEERDRAKRYCSALYKHRLLIASDFPFDECLIKLAHVHEVNTSFQFEFSEFVKQDGPKAAADLFCEAIYNLPDTVVLSLAKKVLPALNAPKARDLHYVFLHCLGHAKCDEEHHTPPSEVNKMPSRSNNSTIGSPFDTKLFCVDLQPWILGVETTHFRETAQRAGLLTTTEVDDLCWMEGNRPPSQHNQELLRILKLEWRRGYVALCALVRDMGKFDEKLQLMNSLLEPGERV
ncbi:uncharacterized protein LOC135825221 [Sycon ciliatum]|uniref:uncharacterized protein LOC135825221 n=1 Tax=Sycon ciliatum TaxID=27933 RepID=UPI0031F6C091